MTARRDWPGEPRESDDAERTPVPLVPAPDKRAPLDLDALQRVGWALVGAVLYLLGVLACGAGLVAVLGWWAGGALVLLAGGAPAGYSLVKAHQLRATQERRAAEAEYRGERAGPVPGLLTSAPVRVID